MAFDNDLGSHEAIWHHSEESHPSPVERKSRLHGYGPATKQVAMVPTSVPSAQAHAEIATTIAVMPDQAKGMMRRSRSHLARQNGALHGGNDHPFEFN